MGAVLTRLLEVFYTKKLDIVVIGLENRYASMVSGYVSCGSPARLLLREEGASMCRQKNFGTVCTCCMMCAWMRRFLAGGTTARPGWNQSMGYQSVLTLIRLLPWCSVVAHPCPSRRGISKSCCRLNKKIRVFHYSNSRLLCFSISSPPQW